MVCRMQQQAQQFLTWLGLNMWNSSRKYQTIYPYPFYLSNVSMIFNIEFTDPVYETNYYLLTCVKYLITPHHGLQILGLDPQIQLLKKSW